jgi:hypothetical protein
MLEGMELELEPESQDDSSSGGVRRPLPALQMLVDHVVQHQKEMAHDPSEADEELWAVLDTAKVVLGDQRITLRQVHEAGWK